MKPEQLAELLDMSVGYPDVYFTPEDVVGVDRQADITLFVGVTAEGFFLHSFVNHVDGRLHWVKYSHDLKFINSGKGSRLSASVMIPSTCFADLCNFDICKLAISRGIEVNFVESHETHKQPLKYADFEKGTAHTDSSTIENHTVRCGNECPYDTFENGTFAAAKTVGVVAARSVLADLTDRRGIKYPLNDLADEARRVLILEVSRITEQYEPLVAAVEILNYLEQTNLAFRIEMREMDDEVRSEMITTLGDLIACSKSVVLPLILPD